MKIYVADGTKLENYVLPTKVEDSFLINYISSKGITENIILSAQNGNWTINEAQNFIIQKGVSAVTSDVIANLNFYDIKFGDIDEKVRMFCFDIPMKYNSYSILDKAKVSLGKSGTEIEYNSAEIGMIHFNIEKVNDSWNLKCDENNNFCTYVNGKRCKYSELQRGDIIFTDGLKIIWMETFILLNDLGGKVKVNLSEYKQLNTLEQGNNFTPVAGTEKYATLYNDDQVFFHTPRFKSSITEQKVHIDPPPAPIKDDGPPAILTLGATVMMGISSSITGVVAVFSVASGKSTLMGSISEIVICLSMIIGSVLFPILLDKYQKKKIKVREKNRQQKYNDYLNKKRTIIAEAMEKEKNIIYQNNLSNSELTENIQNMTNKIWSREISDNDFLTFRLGIGNKRSNIIVEATIEDFRLEDDNLKEEVEAIINGDFDLKNVPITISAIDNRILPIIIDNNCNKRKEIINNIMLQLITFYSGIDLKIVVLTDKTNESFWEYIKYLPHNYSNDNNMHFFASNEDEIKQVSFYLENIYNNRLNKLESHIDKDKKAKSSEGEISYKDFDEYYLIITDNYILAKKFGIIEKILNSNSNIGFSLLMIEPTLKNIPSKCNEFVQFKNTEAGIFSKDLNANNNAFFPEYFEGNISEYSQLIANIPANSNSLINQLPTSLAFLEMYNVGKVEQLNVINRWLDNDPTISLKAPIGVQSDGKLFELDLHEKYHGPHGLIAGSTGSGKSEFIITFILSMAINYHPDEVQFVLIDYKGGGLAGAFENRETGVKLPHLIGTITNLDVGEMNRTLVSINSELKRRQKMFNEARDMLGESTVDIYKYQKFYRAGKVKEPISHLFIISDEFAELKAQQPDFMNELISTARIGRSLGVHLILATQKPSGVVDDQIWSNSKFKICLKVQTSEDSLEMLKRTEAASIKETGRFYLQVGYDELFELGQSAWAGAKYIPLDRIEKPVDDNIRFIDNIGNLLKEVNNVIKVDKQADFGDQLTNIVKNLYTIATREKIQFNQLWLPSIPSEIYLFNTIKKYNYVAEPYLINPIIGEYDVPARQFQNMLSIDFTNTGNLIIYGNPGTGKENLIMTTLYSICAFHNTDEINIYIMDFGAETLKIFNSAPQVGEVVLVEDKNKVTSLLLMLEREMNKRKDLFSNYGGNYSSYIKNAPEKLPLIMIVLNGYESFLENYGDYEDFLAHIIRESSKYGIVFICSATSPNSVKTRISQLFNNKIALQLTDSFDYRFYFNAPNGLIPSKYFGRGIVSLDDTAYEFQSCYIYLKDQIQDILRQNFEKIQDVYQKAKPIPVIPKTITSDTLSAYIDSIENVPIGVNILDATINKYNFFQNRITQILGKNLLIENKFIYNLATILSSVPNIKVEIIDFAECISEDVGIEYINDNFTDNIEKIMINDKTNIKKLYLLLGVGYIYDKVLDEGIQKLSSIFNNLNTYPNSYFVLADNYSSYKRIMKEDWYQNVVDVTSGIWIGKGIDIQNAIKITNLSTSDINEEFNGLGYVSVKGQYQVMKSLGTEEGADRY